MSASVSAPSTQARPTPAVQAKQSDCCGILSSCSTAKIMRWACYFFSALMAVCTGGITASVLAGQVSPLFLVFSFFGFVAGILWGQQARAIIDRTDPAEVTRLREQAQNSTFIELVKRYESDYDKLSFVVPSKADLQRKCLLALQAEPNSSVLRKEAKHMFLHGLIDGHMYKLLTTKPEQLAALAIIHAATNALQSAQS